MIMAEVKEEQERVVIDDPVAQRILDTILERLQTSTDKDTISINGDGNIKDIGIFTYKKKEKGKIDRVYSVIVSQNGRSINLLYAPLDKGDKFAQIVDGQVILDDDIELDRELLNRQVEKAEERERQKEENQNNNPDTNANEGRHIADYTEKTEKKEAMKKKNKSPNENVENKFKPNLNESGIKLNGALIRLDEIINGYYLWEVLKIEDKLKGKLPYGVDEKVFRTGYLTNIDSKELTAKDGKQRKNEDTLAITTADKSVVVELDDSVIQPSEKLATEQQLEAEKNSIINADGYEDRKPTSTTNTRRTSVFIIPDAAKNAGVAETWGLCVGYNDDYIDKGTSPTGGNRKEISFFQQSLNTPTLDLTLQKEAYITKLEDRTREGTSTPSENAQLQELASKSVNEADTNIREHLDNIAKKIIAYCEKEYSDFYKHYNKQDVINKVTEWHNKGLDDEEIESQVKEGISNEIKHGKVRI